MGKLLTLDAYREESYRSLMRIHAAQGLPELALANFEQLRQRLQIELAVEPRITQA